MGNSFYGSDGIFSSKSCSLCFSAGGRKYQVEYLLIYYMKVGMQQHTTILFFEKEGEFYAHRLRACPMG